MTAAHDGPLPSWCAPAARAASVAFGAAVGWRNSRFDRGFSVVRLDMPVVSVGNVVVGGTGKSPMVRWIAAWALRAGHHPLIALRGYRARHGQSDEALEHQREIPEAVVAVGSSRVAQIALARRSHPEVDLVILDDGFQHRRVARDIDCVLIDGRHPHLDGHLLPLGWLREPIESLSRATAVIVTKCAGFDGDLAARIERLHGKPPVAWCTHVWSGIDIHDPREAQGDASASADWLQRRKVAVWAGIARGDDVVAEVERQGAEVVFVPVRRDHADYSEAQVQRLSAQSVCSSAEALVVTGKDWATLAPFRHLVPIPIIVPRLALRFHRGESQFEAMLRESVRRR